MKLMDDGAINYIEKGLIIRLISLPLLAQFYIVFTLGYLNIAPRLYNYMIIYTSAIARFNRAFTYMAYSLALMD